MCGDLSARDPRNPGPPLDASDPRRQTRPPGRANRRRVTKPLQGIGIAAANARGEAGNHASLREYGGSAAQVGPYQALAMEVKKKSSLGTKDARGEAPRASIGPEPDDP